MVDRNIEQEYVRRKQEILLTAKNGDEVEQRCKALAEELKM